MPTLEQTEAEIAKQPLNEILKFSSSLSIDMIRKGPIFLSPRYQGDYLNLAIVDDFPVPLQHASKMYAPGRVPYTGGRHLLIHEQNLAFLSHTALLNSKDVSDISSVYYGGKTRICRLLLMINDLLRPNDVAIPPSNLIDQRHFCLSWLRNWQFGQFSNNKYETLFYLARYHRLFSYFLPNHFKSFEQKFLEATQGITIQKFFEFLTFLVAYIYADESSQNSSISLEMLASSVKTGREEIGLLLKRWVRSPESYQNAFTKLKNENSMNDSHFSSGSDYILLRETPLIELDKDRLFCPVFSFLLAKIVDGPYYLVSDFLGSGSQDQQKFQQAIGLAYQDYAHDLVKQIGHLDKGGEWQVINSPVQDGNELADSYMQRGNVAVSFEHKGQRQGAEFLRGKGGERVLGPDEKALESLDHDNHLSLKEGKKRDKGLLTRGMWQQSIAGPTLLDFAQTKFSIRPNRMYPIITHLSDLHVDEVIQKGYLKPLISKAGLYQEEIWEKPQWLHVKALELLTSLATEGLLNLEDLLREKATKYPDKRFGEFLFERFGPIRLRPILADEIDTLIKNTQTNFWPPEGL